MIANLSLRTGFTRGFCVVTHVVDGLPKGQEARIFNHGTPEYPDWRLWRKIKPEAAMTERQTSYETAEQAFVALQQELSTERDKEIHEGSGPVHDATVAGTVGS